jgi:hypothetical protein
MAKPKLKEKALKLRKEGKSYSQIKEEIDVAKSTLSRWLSDYPLPPERLRELRDNNPRRIEKFRQTMQKKREEEMEEYYKQAKQDIIGTDDSLLLLGFYLYWAEGGKSNRYRVSVSNTDPAMLRFFIDWLEKISAEKEKITATLHAYRDMNPSVEIDFWSKYLNLKPDQFSKPYIKDSNLSDRTYQLKHHHGTCNVFYLKKEIAYYVHGGIRYLQERHKKE